MIGPCFAPPALLEAAPATQSPDGCHNVLTLSCTLQLQAYLGSPLHDLLLLQGGHHLSLDEPCSNMRQLCHKKQGWGSDCSSVSAFLAWKSEALLTATS